MNCPNCHARVEIGGLCPTCRRDQARESREARSQGGSKGGGCLGLIVVLVLGTSLLWTEISKDGGWLAKFSESRMDLPEVKAELASVESKIEEERARWKAASDTINRLTNFKKTPVTEGSPEYLECLEASKIIEEVEAGAPKLKEEKKRLIERAAELEKKVE